MITNNQQRFFQDILDGKIKKTDDAYKYNWYMRHARQSIDKNLKKLIWLAEKFPDVLRDFDHELMNEDLEIRRRAKGLLKAISLFETEPQIIKIVAELYPHYSFEIVKKRKIK